MNLKRLETPQVWKDDLFALPDFVIHKMNFGLAGQVGIGITSRYAIESKTEIVCLYLHTQKTPSRGREAR